MNRSDIIKDFRREWQRITGAPPSRLAMKRVETAAAKVASPQARTPRELFKAAMAGDPDAQRAWREAVVLGGGEAAQAEQAARVRLATGTGKRATVAKASSVRPLPLPAYGPHPAPRADVAPPELAWALEHLSNLPDGAVVPPEVAQRLRAAGIPLPTKRASDLAAWLAPKERIDPATRLPIPQAQRPADDDGYTGKPSPSV